MHSFKVRFQPEGQQESSYKVGFLGQAYVLRYFSGTKMLAMFFMTCFLLMVSEYYSSNGTVQNQCAKAIFSKLKKSLDTVNDEIDHQMNESFYMSGFPLVGGNCNFHAVWPFCPNCPPH